MNVSSASNISDYYAARREDSRVTAANHGAETARIRFENRVEEGKSAAAPPAYSAPAYGGSIEIRPGALVDIRV